MATNLEYIPAGDKHTNKVSGISFKVFSDIEECLEFMDEHSSLHKADLMVYEGSTFHEVKNFSGHPQADVERTRTPVLSWLPLY